MLLALILTAFDFASAADGPATRPGAGSTTTTPQNLKAIATMDARSGAKTNGTITFTQTIPTPTAADAGTTGMRPRVGPMPAIKIVVRLTNATPGNHAVFLHENGDCSASDAASAGAYYPGREVADPLVPASGARDTLFPPGASVGNDPETTAPTNVAGMMNGQPTGYLGFVTVNADGRGEKDLTTAAYTLEPGAYSIANRAIVVYERAPDFTRVGVPDTGARQACGVVKMQATGTLGRVDVPGGDARH